MKAKAKELLDIHCLREFFLKSIVVLNLADALLTSIWVMLGIASEANPIMRTLLDCNILSFVVTKLILVNFGCYLISRLSKFKISFFASLICAVVYYSIMIIHLKIAFFLVSII
jgi:hypothetical protein